MKDLRATIESHREKRERERDLVIAEFDNDLRALADEVIYQRRTVANFAKALRCAQAGAPFAVIGPGPHWQPRKSEHTDMKEVPRNDG
jgi:hypothetical protein